MSGGGGGGGDAGGLKNPKAAHLNGKQATLFEELPALGRWLVQLDGGAGQAKLKPESLSAVKRPASAVKRSAPKPKNPAGAAVDPIALMEQTRCFPRNPKPTYQPGCFA